ncbi:MAG TPA: hypothetical protein VER96_19745 [Polyangiaceae bacterium]|nr:hypothetical protein [Polyangiaceae bacterium]
MSRKRESKKAGTPASSVSRRRLLEGLGALVAAGACSSEPHRNFGTGGSGSGGSTGSLGAGGLHGAGGPGRAGAPGAGGALDEAGAGALGEAGEGGEAGAFGEAGAPGVGGSPSTAGSGGTAGKAGTAGSGGKGGSAGTAAGGASNTAGAGGSSTGAGGTSSTGGLVSPPWTGVPVQDSTDPSNPKPLACDVVTRVDSSGQGPFFIHELEIPNDVTLVRQDIRGQYDPAAEKGMDMELYVRVLDKTKNDAGCINLVPVPNIEVYIWHPDAQGYTSGFGTKGSSTEQKPDAPYTGSPGANNLENLDRFCRGVQVTDADGVAAFLSVFPGWFNGRALHICVACFKKGSQSRGRVAYNKSIEPAWIFTTQFYFDAQFSKSIHESVEPYKRRTSLSAYAGAMAATESGNSGRHATATQNGNKVIAQIQIVVDPS